MKLQLLVSEGLLLLHYTETAIYSAKFQFWNIWLSKVSCTYLSWKVCGCHYHQYLNTSQTTGKHILLHLFKDIIVNCPHFTHKKDYVACLRAMRMLGWSQECSLVLLVSSASEENGLEFREASLETLLLLSFSWEWGSAPVTGSLKWSISPFFGQKG